MCDRPTRSPLPDNMSLRCCASVLAPPPVLPPPPSPPPPPPLAPATPVPLCINVCGGCMRRMSGDMSGKQQPHRRSVRTTKPTHHLLPEPLYQLPTPRRLRLRAVQSMCKQGLVNDAIATTPDRQPSLGPQASSNHQQSPHKHKHAHAELPRVLLHRPQAEVEPVHGLLQIRHLRSCVHGHGFVDQSAARTTGQCAIKQHFIGKPTPRTYLLPGRAGPPRAEADRTGLGLLVLDHPLRGREGCHPS